MGDARAAVGGRFLRASIRGREEIFWQESEENTGGPASDMLGQCGIGSLYFSPVHNPYFFFFTGSYLRRGRRFLKRPAPLEFPDSESRLRFFPLLS
jgi:hypothetical protein